VDGDNAGFCYFLSFLIHKPGAVRKSNFKMDWKRWLFRQ